ncbi:MAG: glycoside hydrolase family 16 protein [Candidatus Coproplasma sp.]
MANVLWNKKPNIRRVFYDDFSQGIRTEVWRALNETWSSQVNNGFSELNCLYSTSFERVNQTGGTGGIVAIRSNGDYATDRTRKRQGGGIVTKELFGPGLYEVRMKVVPRVGQCSAIWTYYNNWKTPMSEREYSEIDTELPHGGDYRKYSGTTYSNYLNDSEKEVSSEVIESSSPLNDEKWHIFAFEWRTAKESGDEGIIWYRDGKPVLTIREHVPQYSATFWIASLFQDAPAWLGVPRFEEAYLYVDWVRITEYDDPVKDGKAEKESLLSYTGIDLGDSPLPVNQYLANSDFSKGATEVDFKGIERTVWQLDGNASIESGKLILPCKGCASQVIEAQYVGATFNVSVEAEGEVEAYLEFLTGKANCIQPEYKVIGRSDSEYLCGNGEVSEAELSVDSEATEHIRLVLKSVCGAKVSNVQLKRK